DALMQALDNLITSGEYADILKAQGLEDGAVTKAGIVHHVLGGEAEHRHRAPGRWPATTFDLC
ncbi:hypothetical protein ACFXI5_24245, partial [Streptomyces niveus]